MVAGRAARALLLTAATAASVASQAEPVSDTPVSPLSRGECTNRLGMPFSTSFAIEQFGVTSRLQPSVCLFPALLPQTLLQGLKRKTQLHHNASSVPASDKMTNISQTMLVRRGSEGDCGARYAWFNTTCVITACVWHASTELRDEFFSSNEYETVVGELVERLPVDEETYDFIVVGGGAAGCAVADALSQGASLSFIFRRKQHLAKIECQCTLQAVFVNGTYVWALVRRAFPPCRVYFSMLQQLLSFLRSAGGKKVLLLERGMQRTKETTPNAMSAKGAGKDFSCGGWHVAAQFSKFMLRRPPSCSALRRDSILSRYASAQGLALLTQPFLKQ